MKRREFLATGAYASAYATATASASAVFLQGGGKAQTNFAPMDQGGHRPVVRAPKPNATPSMNDAARDTFEHALKCMCGGCMLNVYTCRTTDFSCPVSPAMHGDVQALVAGGYTADEILDAFVGVYGERVLTAPKKTGFNWAGYVMPFVAMAGGVVMVTMLLKRWTRQPGAPVSVSALPHGVDASPDELARLTAAVRDDEDDEA